VAETLFEFVACQRQCVEDALGEWLPVSSQPGAERLNGALRYALFPGGKRLRPIFTMLGASLVGARPRRALASACAIEFLHNSSLILDDLPGMDDADLRRNRRALHLVYGEGIAVLAAVALLNQAYALLVQSASDALRPGAVEALMNEATRCIGVDGMIGGQVVDLETGPNGSCAERLASRDLKTVALMRLMMICGALASGADAHDIAALAKFGECLGKAYQICDDLLDEPGDLRATGKPKGQDARHLRLNVVAGLGVERAHRMAARLIEEAKRALLETFGERREVRLLSEAADLVIMKVERVGPVIRAEVAQGVVSMR
jgi:geranylgeranyl diphosphate synthase type II